MTKNIDAEIEKAQNTLNEINLAINRDRLSAEDATKKLTELQAQKATIESTIDKLISQEKEAKDSLALAQEKHQKVVDDFAIKKQTLLDEEATLKQSIAQLQDEVSKLQKTITKETDLLLKDRLKQEKELEAKLSELLEKQSKAISELNAMNELVGSTKLILDDLNNRIRASKSEEDKLQKVLLQIEDNQKTLSGLVAEQADVKANIQKLRSTEKQLEQEIEAISKAKEQAHDELEAQKSEVAEFNKQKLLFLQQKTALEQREARIKDLFEQAGIPL